MTSPVQLSDLDLATSADDADLALIRKNNTTDYKVTVQLLRDINIPGLPALTSFPAATDLLIVSQGGVNSKCNFGSIGFTVGTQMWFYMNSVPVSPSFWQIIPNTGDRLLAVRGGATYVTGGSSTSTNLWQQTDHTLTLAQIPAHSHNYKVYKSDIDGNLSFKTASTNRSSNNTTKTDDAGGGQGHNHGNTWRPAASVGILCQKIL